MRANGMDKAANDAAQILAGLLESGQELMQSSLASMGGGAALGDPANPAAQWLEATKRVAEMQQDYLKQLTGFWTTAMGAANPWQLIAGANPWLSSPTPPDSADKRFAAEAWNDPHFDLIKRTYLAYAKFLGDSVEAAPVDERTKGQLRFAARQIVDAMSPANYLATNPEAMLLAAESGGQSLADGMNLFMHDLAAGRISITDERAFEVGKNLASTPGAVVFENELIQLIQCAPSRWPARTGSTE